MKIAKEIKELLKKDDGSWEINECFTLRHWVLHPENDIVGRSGEYLELVMNPVNDGRHNYFSRKIEARDTQGIIDEVTAKMQDILAEYTDQLVRRWRGGLQ